MTTKTFSKFTRPQQGRRGIITDRDLDIISTIVRYRFSPTSELVRLVGGNEDVTRRRLRSLWEWGYVNRFAFPGIRTHSEFIYYLDRPQAIELLAQHNRLSVTEARAANDVQLNRNAAYADAVLSGQHMKLAFVQHALMVSRLHFMIELVVRRSRGNIELSSWRQGGELRGNKAPLPALKSTRVESNDYVWQEDERTTNYPVEPDAIFTLRFHNRAPGNQSVHFCYEADRGSMPMADMLKKFRAYYHFIKRLQYHRATFQIHPVRAVLIETTNEARARKLMRLAEHPLVIGHSKRCALFWFVISPLFATRTAQSSDKTCSAYLVQPEMIFDRIWALPDATLHGLGDVKNAA